MKKTLKLRSLREKEVPSSLDAVILTAAALHLKRRRRRLLRRVLSGAAAACFVCAILAGRSYLAPTLPQKPDTVPAPVARQKNLPAPMQTVSQVLATRQLPARPSAKELLAMGDFTTLEQENFAFDQASYASGVPGDNLI